MNLFEMATRKKMRFPFKGLVSIEDLWDLSVTNLDSIYKALMKEAKNANEESLLTTKSAADEMLTAQIEIVKYIVGIKQAEALESSQAVVRKAEREKIMGILANKQDAALLDKTPEELQEMLKNL